LNLYPLAAHSVERPGREGHQEGETKMSVDAKRKLWEAVHALAIDGEIGKRLTFACDHLAGLQEAQIPSECLAEFRAIKAALVATKLSSERGYVDQQISTEDAVAMSRRIVNLFTEIMGGLA
jgi:hypothetical protein